VETSRILREERRPIEDGRAAIELRARESSLSFFISLVQGLGFRFRESSLSKDWESRFEV